MKIIIGLGNPGKKYQNSRHNFGFLVLDYLRDKLSPANFSGWQENKKFQAEISEGFLNKEKIILAKPMTFMNNSGQAVSAILSYYKTSPDDLLVVHDDIDILFGGYKIQKDRSSAGHRGVQSIINILGTQNFTRLRLGIAPKNKEKQTTEEYVLRPFGLFEKLRLNKIKSIAVEEVLNWGTPPFPA